MLLVVTFLLLGKMLIRVRNHVRNNKRILKQVLFKYTLNGFV